MTWLLHLVSFTDKELTNSLFKAPNRLQNVSRQALVLYLLSYTDKEQTKLTCTCFWLVEQYQYVIWFDKKRFREKSHKMTGKFPLLLQILESTIDGLSCFPFIQLTQNEVRHSFLFDRWIFCTWKQKQKVNTYIRIRIET